MAVLSQAINNKKIYNELKLHQQHNPINVSKMTVVLMHVLVLQLTRINHCKQYLIALISHYK